MRIGLTGEAAWVGNEAESMAQVVFDKVLATSHCGYDDDLPFLALKLLHRTNFDAVSNASKRGPDLEALSVIGSNNSNLAISFRVYDYQWMAHEQRRINLLALKPRPSLSFRT